MNLAQALNLISSRVRSLAAYHLEPEETDIKLNQNENPYDWPAEIKEDAARFCQSHPWNRYPPFIPNDLKAALGAYAGVGAENIIVGNGSNEMLLVLLLSLVEPSRKVIICQPTFTVYRLLARGLGGVEEGVMARPDLSIDANAVVAAARRCPGAVLVLCSPNNPTGAALSEQEIRRILDAHTGFCILDQAYVDFGGYSALPLLAGHPNLIITRTFSKAFGAAGLRLGYMVGAPAVIAELAKIKLPYNINFFSEHVARLLLSNTESVARRVADIGRERDRLYRGLSALPFDNVYPSAANFVLVRLGGKDAFFSYLKKQGILVRDVSKYPMLENCLRISVGAPRENDRLLAAAGSYFSSQP